MLSSDGRNLQIDCDTNVQIKLISAFLSIVMIVFHSPGGRAVSVFANCRCRNAAVACFCALSVDVIPCYSILMLFTVMNNDVFMIL